MTKHTPAPWIVSTRNQSMVQCSKTEVLIADCRNLAIMKSCQANARLIAAAPELLEACELALISDDRSVKDVLRAAIAKAKCE